MKTTWSLEDLRRVHVLKSRIGRVNTAIFEMAQVRDQLDAECMKAVAALIGMEGSMLLEAHWQCAASPTEHCLYEITAESKDEVCLFCVQSITR